MAQIPAPVAFDCTPSSLLDSSPCLKCLSEKELLGVILAIIVSALGTTVAQALEDSKCFTCLSKKQMLQSLTTVLGNDLLGERYSQDAILADLACLRCSNETQLRAAILYLLCNDLTVSAQNLL